MKNCISVDWLTLHVQVPHKQFEKTETKYKIVRDKSQTRHFKSIFYIYDKNGAEMATLACEPHSDILQHDSGLLKLNNRVDYQKDLLPFVKQFLKDLKLNFRSISRIDIALDFLKFKNNLNPRNFIKNYISGKYIKNGKGRGRIEFKYGNSKSLQYQTLKFGSETSDVTYYLYNKVEEMEAKELKPWIVDNWRANGWDGKQHVWRLEFSLKPTTKTIHDFIPDDKDPDGGVLKEVFSFKDIESIDKLQDIYNSHFKKYFTFVHNEKKLRKDRCKPVVLFAGKIQTSSVRISVSDKKIADRTDKIFTRKLMEFNSEMRGFDMQLSVTTNELLSCFVLGRGLKTWAEDKLKYTVTEKQEIAYQQRNFALIQNSKNDYGTMPIAKEKRVGAQMPNMLKWRGWTLSFDGVTKVNLYHKR